LYHSLSGLDHRPVLFIFIRSIIISFQFQKNAHTQQKMEKIISNHKKGQANKQSIIVLLYFFL